MGNDGGSIPRRIELVKEKADTKKANPDIERREAWNNCALSKAPLQPPIAACGLGKLYNQDAVIQFILDPSAFGDADKICSHIRSMKDICKLNVTDNPAYNESKNRAESATMGTLDKDVKSRFICPVTMKEMNGRHRFVYVDTCGCVFAEQALKEIQTEDCIVCGKPFTQDNVIVLNPVKEEIERMKTIMEEKKAKAKVGKKSKKNKGESEKKRKHVSLVDQVEKDRSKKAHVAQATASAVIDKIAKELAQKDKKATSAAIKSLYAGKEPETKKGNYLTMGTFNRYA